VIARTQGQDRLSPARHPSARVRLEAALLDDDDPAPASSAVPDGGPCSTVLVVAAEADIRRYVRECLRERPALRVMEAATVDAAVALAAGQLPVCLVVDGPERAVLRALASHRAVVLVDDSSADVRGDVPDGLPAPRHRLLASPFTARELVAEVDRLVG
jgi:DNA-binding response OmpR family regulator